MAFYLIAWILSCLVFGLILNRFLPETPAEERFLEKDEFRKELEADLQKEGISLIKIFIPPMFDSGPFSKREHGPRRTRIELAGFKTYPTYTYRKCLIERDHLQVEAWCRIRTRWGRFVSAEWRKME
jgi:hypothetical protein